MEFKNGYNFMYQKAKAIYASKIGRPAADDEAVDFGLTDEEKKNIKLVYENKNGLVVSFSNIPSADDKEITATIDGVPVIGPSGSEPVVTLAKIINGQEYASSDVYFNTNNKIDIATWPLVYDPYYDGMGMGVLALKFKYLEDGHEAEIRFEIMDISGLDPAIIGVEIPGISEMPANSFMIYDNRFGCTLYIGNDAMIELLKIEYAEYPELVDSFKVGWQAESLAAIEDLYSSFFGSEISFFNNQKAVADIYADPEPDSGIIPEDLWNGVVIGTKNTPGPGPGPTPSSLTPFEIGQIVKGFDFGNVGNGDTNLDLDAFLLALEPSSEALMVSSDDYEQLLLCGRFDGSSESQPNVGIIMDNATQTVLYATDDYYEHGEKYCSKGYQNLTDGKYILPGDVTFEVARMNEGVEDTSWNGRLVGAILGEPGPTPSLTPFELGQTLSNGDKIHFDTSKGDELADYMNSVEYDQTYHMFELMRIVDPNTSDAMPLVFADATQYGAQGKILIWDTDVIFATEAGSINFGIEISYTQGFQNLDENGDYVLPLPQEMFPNGQGEIVSIGDTNPPTWNGIIAGYVQGAGPSLDAFYIGQALHNGNKIHFDTSADWDSFLANLSYTDGECYPMYIDNDDLPALMAFDLENGLYVFGIYNPTASGEIDVIYATDTQGPYTRGFQNLDDNNDYTLRVSTDGTDKIISSIDNTGNWNGTILGLVQD